MNPSELNDIARDYVARAIELRAPKWKPGDVVYLKSGSPPLTVWDGARSDGLTCVQWFAGDELRGDVFDPECLRMDPSNPDVRCR